LSPSGKFPEEEKSGWHTPINHKKSKLTIKMHTPINRKPPRLQVVGAHERPASEKPRAALHQTQSLVTTRNAAKPVAIKKQTLIKSQRMNSIGNET
jgi:hypothetical protein